MGIAYNSSIVTNGLVLCLDAGNPRSYPGTGTAWNDVSGTGSNGTLTNGPTYNSANLGSIVLDGVNDFVLVSPVANTIRTYNATCQFVIKLPTYAGGQRNILSYRDAGMGQLYIGKSSGGIFCYYDSWNSPGFTVGSITDNTIAICCVVLDATNTTVSTYINGVLAGSGTRTGWVATYGTALRLGYDIGTAEYMLGNFYHFSHYSRVLSATEITQNFNALRGRYGL